MPVLLVHGVGFGPETLGEVARQLDRDHEVHVVERRGYGSRAGEPPAARIADHVDDVVSALDAAVIERAVLVGISGGATVALAAALACPERVSHAVVHEPAVGSLVPELRAQIRAALARGGGEALLTTLAGPATWGRLPAAQRRELIGRRALVERDARAFLAFEPDLPEAPERGVGQRLTCSLGERSGPLRVRVARRLRERAGAAVVTVPGAGHLAQIDAPVAFAATVRAACASHDSRHLCASHDERDER